MMPRLLTQDTCVNLFAVIRGVSQDRNPSGEVAKRIARLKGCKEWITKKKTNVKRTRQERAKQQTRRGREVAFSGLGVAPERASTIWKRRKKAGEIVRRQGD